MCLELTAVHLWDVLCSLHSYKYNFARVMLVLLLAC